MEQHSSAQSETAFSETVINMEQQSRVQNETIFDDSAKYGTEQSAEWNCLWWRMNFGGTSILVERPTRSHLQPLISQMDTHATKG